MKELLKFSDYAWLYIWFYLNFYLKKNKNVTVMTLGIGRDIDHDELLSIATNKNYVFLAEDYDKLVSEIEKISNMTCHERTYFVFE